MRSRNFWAAGAGSGCRLHSPGAPRDGANGLRVPGCFAAAAAATTWHPGKAVRTRKAEGGEAEVMSAKAAGPGGWEVVKKGRRPGASGGGRGGGGGGGDRRALGEANGVWKYDLSCEYPPPPTWACGAGARRSSCGSRERIRGTPAIPPEVPGEVAIPTALVRKRRPSEADSRVGRDWNSDLHLFRPLHTALSAVPALVGQVSE